MRPLVFALRLIVSALLIGWLVRLIDVTAVLGLLRQAHAPWLALALLSVVATHLVHCWRWRTSLLDQGRRMSFRALVVSYWTSLFVGLVLPTEYGGDVLRVKDAWSRTASGSAAVASVLWSRASGIAATFFVFAGVGLLRWSRLSETSLIGVWAISALICLALLLVIFVRPVFELMLRNMEHLPGPEKWRAGLLERVHTLDAHRDLARRIVALAFVAQGLMILTNSLYAVALDQPVAMLDMALVVPLVTLSSLLPISVGGLGVKEGAFVVALSVFGLSGEGALSIALLNRLVLLALALAGGLLFPFRQRLMADDDPSAEAR